MYLKRSHFYFAVFVTFIMLSVFLLSYVIVSVYVLVYVFVHL